MSRAARRRTQLERLEQLAEPGSDDSIFRTLGVDGTLDLLLWAIRLFPDDDDHDLVLLAVSQLHKLDRDYAVDIGEGFLRCRYTEEEQSRVRALLGA